MLCTRTVEGPQDESRGVNIIACDSTTFKKGKRCLSPFEAELSGVHWALTKEDYYCRGAPKITVMFDAKSMAGFLAQDLDKIDSSIQCGDQIRARPLHGIF